MYPLLYTSDYRGIPIESQYKMADPNYFVYLSKYFLIFLCILSKNKVPIAKPPGLC